jgi:hypothetical protein
MMPVVDMAVQQKKRWNANAVNQKTGLKQGGWEVVKQIPDDCWFDFAAEARQDEDC